MENLDQQIKKNGFNSGVLLGVIILVLGIFTFYLITGMTTSLVVVIGGPIILSVLVPIALAVFFCIGLRKKIGGFWTFKQAVTGIFIMFFTAYVIQAVFSDLIFAKFVEPQMVEKVDNAVMSATKTMMEKANTPQETIDSKVADMQKQFDDQKNVTMGKTISGILISILFRFVFALIFAAMFKREPLKPTTDYVDPAV
ncbi:MAG: DUF4199 domain-containing protein [Sphingobacteriales bacterium]